MKAKPLPSSPIVPVPDEVFRLLVENARDYAIFILDPGGHIASWNPGAQAMKGYLPEEVIGKHFSILYPRDAVERGWPAYILQRAATTGHFEDQGWRVRKGGELFWARVVITAIRAPDGTLRGFSKITSDLTQNRRYQERLRQSEERFRLLVEGIQDYAIFMLDRTGRVASWNLGAERIKGYRAEEIIGQPFARFYPEEEIEAGKPEQDLADARRSGSTRVEGWRVRKDGSRFMAEMILTAITDRNGALRGYAKLTRDLTQTKRIEALEAEGQRVSEFLAMLAHELRNPLAPISNALTLLGMDDVTPKERQWSRAVIARQMGQLTRLVDDLLDVSRITRGKIRISRDDVDLQAVIDLAVEATLPAIEAREHILSVTPLKEPVWLIGDQARLVQVLSNVLNNAAKYTPPGGSIEIRTERQDGSVVIRVKDNGVGMTAELMEKAFDLFSQGERTLDRSEGGLGIGLTLVERIVKLHSGSVAVSSEGPGRGSEFAITLPVAVKRQAPRPPTPAPDSARTTGGARRRVLIVDDNRDAAKSMAAIITNLGHRPALAYTGALALWAAKRQRPDLVLLDIGLPGLDGYEVARRIRRCPGLENVRLAAVTGYGQERDREMAREAGFDAFLVKPMSLDDLNALLGGLS